ncbi:hypothetical protein B296_00007563 [Ensete ventricosum]|uniref:Cytochrome c oxidase subunit 5C n=1 Tax=Ensete ventricosum TaxID=4639 RepID=A0A426Z734_ENSVE|nr:hypothetical protein B296_00007563 [Ensete ventricosum]
MAAHKIAHATLKGPSVVKEICIGLTLGLFAGGLWKMHQWNEQRKTRAFYDMLEKGPCALARPRSSQYGVEAQSDEWRFRARLGKSATGMVELRSGGNAPARVGH